MDVSDLFMLLSHGPLSNLSMSNNGDGTIAENAQGKLIDYANDGLLRLFTKFQLSEKELLIRMSEGVTNYYLMSRFSQQGHTGNLPIYIMDQLDPYKDDLIKVLSVFGPDNGQLPLNDVDNPCSVFTPKFNLLQVPSPIDAAMLSVIYQARHKKLEYGIMEQTIDLPDTVQEALVNFIASRVYRDMGGQENTLKGQELDATYRALIGETVENDALNTTLSNTNTNFERKGWI